MIHCDNARTFEMADRELKKLYKSLDWAKIQKHFIQLPERIEFNFCPPRSPWRNGQAERMVGSLKRALRATLGNQRASLEEFRTVLCQCEAVVNSRPLTTVSDDSRDAIPISPSHLIMGRSLQQIPDDLGKDDLNSRIAIQWKERQRLHAEFTGRWRKEYLLSLSPSLKWTRPGQEPRIGEVVLLGDKPVSRILWPLAVIKELHPGRDGKTRTVTLKTADGQVWRRDLRLLYRLEEQQTTTTDEQTPSEAAPNAS